MSANIFCCAESGRRNLLNKRFWVYLHSSAKRFRSHTNALIISAWAIGFGTSLWVGPALAIDSWQLLKETVCAQDKLQTATAIQVSFFEFRRKDGFECAQRVLKVLSTELANDPNAKIGTSRLLWSMFAVTVDDPGQDAEFRGITNSIRLTNGHPLRGEARLAQLRLSVIRGKPVSEVSSQLKSILADLGYRQDMRALVQLYDSGSLSLRESLRWLFSAYARSRIDFSLAQLPLDPRLRSIADWGQEMAFIGSVNPEILQYIVADAWKNGRRLITPGALPLTVAAQSLPEISGRLEYSLCASGNCQTQIANMTTVSDQIVEKRESLNITHAVASIRYGIGSTPIKQSTCKLIGTNTPCAQEGIEDVGRHYWVWVSSLVVGGAAWKDSFYKEMKGIDDRKSRASYKFIAQVPIPLCADPAKCAVTVAVGAKMFLEGQDTNSVRSIILKRPDGSETILPANDTVTIDRSSGAHMLQIELSWSREESGSSSTQFNQSISVSVRSDAKLTKHFVIFTKELLEQQGKSLTNYLPLILMARALTFRSAVLNDVPEYMGLGETLGQYSEPDPLNRWIRIYTPLYFIHLLKTSVGPELLPMERRGMDLSGRVLSNAAINNFGEYVDQQISFLKALQPALSVALIDGAIAAIQKEQPLDASITPFVQTLLAVPSIGSNPGDQSVAQAKDLVNSARVKDNLLDAVLLLYQARERLQQANEKVSLQLEFLSIEKTGLLKP